MRAPAFPGPGARMQEDGAQAEVGWIVDEQGAGRRAGSDL